MLVSWVVGRNSCTFEIIHGGLQAECLVDFWGCFPIYVAYNSLRGDVDEGIARLLGRLLAHTVNNRLFYIVIRCIIPNRILLDFVCDLIEIACANTDALSVRLSVEFWVAQDRRLDKDIVSRRFTVCLVCVVDAGLDLWLIDLRLIGEGGWDNVTDILIALLFTSMIHLQRVLLHELCLVEMVRAGSCEGWVLIVKNGRHGRDAYIHTLRLTNQIIPVDLCLQEPVFTNKLFWVSIVLFLISICFGIHGGHPKVYEFPYAPWRCCISALALLRLLLLLAHLIWWLRSLPSSTFWFWASLFVWDRLLMVKLNHVGGVGTLVVISVPVLYPSFM